MNPEVPRFHPFPSKTTVERSIANHEIDFPGKDRRAQKEKARRRWRDDWVVVRGVRLSSTTEQVGQGSLFHDLRSSARPLF